jgi:uncharacterized membrane protein YgcG
VAVATACALIAGILGSSAILAADPAASATPMPVVPSLAPVPAGPPFQEPITGLAVYDYAGVLQPATVQSIGQTIAAIGERTGASVVVYLQVKPESETGPAAQADAGELMHEWDIGGQYGTGLLVFFDLDASRCHGQVQLYAGRAFSQSYLDGPARAQILSQSMLPSLLTCDFDTALLSAMARVDAATQAPSGSPSPGVGASAGPTP